LLYLRYQTRNSLFIPFFFSLPGASSALAPHLGAVFAATDALPSNLAFVAPITDGYDAATATVAEEEAEAAAVEEVTLMVLDAANDAAAAAAAAVGGGNGDNNVDVDDDAAYEAAKAGVVAARAVERATAAAAAVAAAESTAASTHSAAVAAAAAAAVEQSQFAAATLPRPTSIWLLGRPLSGKATLGARVRFRVFGCKIKDDRAHCTYFTHACTHILDTHSHTHSHTIRTCHSHLSPLTSFHSPFFSAGGVVGRDAYQR
jgi:hypothetical protein